MNQYIQTWEQSHQKGKNILIPQLAFVQSHQNQLFVFRFDTLRYEVESSEAKVKM